MQRYQRSKTETKPQRFASARCFGEVQVKFLFALLVITNLLFAALAADTSFGNDTKKILVSSYKHDFGTVARGAKTVHHFKLKNPYDQPMIISDVRSSCGCTRASAPSKTIPPNQTGIVRAEFNTRSFLGAKSATVTVVIRQPVFKEIQLRVSGNIRGDIVIQPGQLEFKDIKSGESKSVTTEIHYAGNSSWKIVDIRSSLGFLVADLKETERRNGSVKYQLKVTMEGDFPEGLIRDQLTLLTNDSKNRKIPLSFRATVSTPLAISPKQIELAQSQPATKRLVLKSNQAFRITNIETRDKRFSFDYGSNSRKTQLVTLRFNPLEGIPLSKDVSVRIQTSLGKSHSQLVRIRIDD